MFYFLFFWGVFEIWVWRRDRGRIVRWGRRAELELAEDSWIVRQYGYAAPVAVRACPELWPSCPPPLFFFPWNYGFILHFWTDMTLSPSFLMRGRESGNEQGGWKKRNTWMNIHRQRNHELRHRRIKNILRKSLAKNLVKGPSRPAWQAHLMRWQNCKII